MKISPRRSGKLSKSTLGYFPDLPANHEAAIERLVAEEHAARWRDAQISRYLPPDADLISYGEWRDAEKKFAAAEAAEGR